MNTYRAAYIGDCVLTAPEHSTLSDKDLIKIALVEARQANVEILEKDIEIGEWTTQY